MLKNLFKRFSNVRCNHSFIMKEVWDTSKDPKCTKCGELLSELTPKVKKK
jgi:hypothetical protein